MAMRINRTVLATATGVLAALVLALVIFFATRAKDRVMCPGPDDSLNLRHIAGLLVARYSRPPHGDGHGKLPMKDSALDVYRLVANGDLCGKDLTLLWSAHTGMGPMGEDLLRGDYTNFPWERYRGDGKLEGPPFPLLWEKKPDKHGGGLVAFSDGSLKYVEHFEAVVHRPR
jgi:hypothetical protein